MNNIKLDAIEKRAHLMHSAFALLLVFSVMVYPVTVLPAPTVFPTGVTIHDSSKAYNGHTLLRVGKSYGRVILIDMDGNIVNEWKSPTWTKFRNIGHAKPLPGRRILVFLYTGSTEDKKLVEMNWDGRILWRYRDPNFAFLHHDFERLENGNTLILGSPKPYTVFNHISPHKVRNDVIREIDKGGNVAWEWSTADHYDQLPLTEEERRIIFDENRADIFHTNSIQSLPANPYESVNLAFSEGNILVSQRNTSFVFIIDKTSGDIVWHTRGETVGQHQVKMIPYGTPGEGDILAFDNGWRGGIVRQYHFWSRIYQFNPVSDEATWIYDANLSGKGLATFFSPYRSGVQRLPNGNTFVCESRWGRLFEVAEDGEIVWEFINPEFIDNLSRDFPNWLYRAYRVSPDWAQGGELSPSGPFKW